MGGGDGVPCGYILRAEPAGPADGVDVQESKGGIEDDARSCDVNSQ